MRKKGKSFIGDLISYKIWEERFPERYASRTKRITMIEKKLRELDPASKEFEKLREMKYELEGRLPSAVTNREQKIAEIKAQIEEYKELDEERKKVNEIAHRLERDSLIKAREEQAEWSRRFLRPLSKKYAQTRNVNERTVLESKMAEVRARQPVIAPISQSLASVASVIKVKTGTDDSMALRKAKDVLNRAMVQREGQIEEIVEDIFEKGENSKYLKVFSNAKEKKVRPHIEDYIRD